MFPISRKSRILVVIALLAAAVGFADALYLTIKHYAAGPVSCGLVGGCSVVLESYWSVILGLPTALFGALYYGLFLSGLVVFLSTRRMLFLQLALALVTIGLVVSFGFLYLQIFVITALCQFCLLSLLTTFAGWVSVFFFTRRDDVIIDPHDE